MVLLLICVQEYHRTVLKNIGIDGKVTPPPPAVALNKNNINLAQKAILEEYQTSDGAENPYAALRACKWEVLLINARRNTEISREMNGTHVCTLSHQMK